LEHRSFVVWQHCDVTSQWSSVRQKAGSVFPLKMFEDLQNQGAGPSQNPVLALQNTPSHLKNYKKIL
jgi:hypothetical protein